MKHTVLLAALAGLAFAWPVELVRSTGLDNNGTSATGIFDLDGDSVPELLVAGNTHLYCYDAAGTIRWMFTPASNYFPAVSSPVAADIDNDGAVEVVVATPLAVYALSADGDSLWRRTLGGQGSVQNSIASVALGDINGDSLLEVFAYEVYENRLLCLEPLAGDTLWTYADTSGARFSVGTPTVADLECDGRFEVLGQVSYTAGGGQLYCLDAEGNKLWSYNTAGSGISGWQCASAAVGDVDADDTLEVFGVANYWGVFCVDHRGAEQWTRRVSEHAASYPAIADIDNDDTLDVVLAIGPAMRCLNGRTGRDQWSYTVASGYYIVSSPGIGDLDGDGLLETVFAEVKQNNPNDSLRPMWLLNSSGQAIWNDTVGTTMSDATLGDIDRDGRVEFCIGPTYRWSQWWLYRADTVAVRPGRVDWSTLQHDIWRTGLYGYEGPSTSVSEPRAVVPARPRLSAVPNPVRGGVLFSLGGRGGGAVTVFDASGRLVRTLELDRRGETRWTGTDEHGRRCAPGVYFCTAPAADASARLVLAE